MPRQDSLVDQLRDLRVLANQKGMYDAADWITKHIEDIEGREREQEVQEGR